MLVFHPPPRFVAKAMSQSAVERLIDSLSPKMQRALRKAIQTARGRIDVEALARAVEQGRVSRAVLQVNVDRFTGTDLAEAAKVINEAFVSGVVLGETQIKGAYRFDVTNPKALDAAERQAATLLTAVNEETKQTVRTLIGRAYREGNTAQETARMIRGVVGLNDRQATALTNYRAGLLEEGIAPDRLEVLADRYSARLLRQRAEMISRAEIHRASSEGQHELWREGVRNGYINPTRARRTWNTNQGACSWCLGVADANADGVPIDGLFVTPDGATISGTADSHVNCRCSETLAFGEE